MKKTIIAIFLVMMNLLMGCASSKIIVGKVEGSKIAGGELDHPTTYVSINGTTYKIDGARFFKQGQIVKLKCYEGVYQYLLTSSCHQVG